jgi:hypothetical protein
MNASSLACVALGLTVSLTGCGILKKKQPEPAASVAAATSALTAPPVVPTVPTPPIVPAVPALDEASVPAPQDFEDEAFEKVTTANFKAELARLTREITAPAAK